MYFRGDARWRPRTASDAIGRRSGVWSDARLASADVIGRPIGRPSGVRGRHRTPRWRPVGRPPGVRGRHRTPAVRIKVFRYGNSRPLRQLYQKPYSVVPEVVNLKCYLLNNLSHVVEVTPTSRRFEGSRYTLTTKREL